MKNITLQSLNYKILITKIFQIQKYFSRHVIPITELLSKSPSFFKAGFEIHFTAKLNQCPDPVEHYLFVIIRRAERCRQLEQLHGHLLLSSSFLQVSRCRFPCCTGECRPVHNIYMNDIHYSSFLRRQKQHFQF